MAEDANVNWEATAEVLGKLIEKPKMTEKVLSRPPFKFILDVIVNVMKQHGFPEGLYNEDELQDNSDRDARAAFLKKAFDATAYTLGRKVPTNPTKVVKGQDPKATNEWLRMFAEAATASTANKEKGVKKALQKAAEAGSKPAEAEEKKSSKDKKGEAAAEKEETGKKDRERGKDRKDDGKKEKKDKKPMKADEKAEEAPEPPPAPVDPLAEAAGKLGRPSTSRRAPPVVKENVQKEAGTQEVTSKQVRASGVIVGNDKNLDDDDEAQREMDLQAQFVREDAQIQGGGGDGYLTKLAQQDLEKAKVQIVREDDGGLLLGHTGRKKEKSTLDTEVQKMVEQLQTLVKTTNPLGKAMDYVQEDVDSMARELEALRNETVQQGLMFAEQQKATDEQLEPLRQQMEDVDADIMEQHQKTYMLMGKILANDDDINHLITMVVITDDE